MSRVTPHAVPLIGLLSRESAEELRSLLREPRLEARAEGGRAFYKGGTNPFDAGTPEAIGWQAGWDYEQGQNS